MGEMRIVGDPYAEPVVWDPRDRDSVEAAFRTWRRLKRGGYEFSTTDGRRLTRFNKRDDLVLAIMGPS